MSLYTTGVNMKEVEFFTLSKKKSIKHKTRFTVGVLLNVRNFMEYPFTITISNKISEFKYRKYKYVVYHEDDMFFLLGEHPVNCTVFLNKINDDLNLKNYISVTSTKRNNT